MTEPVPYREALERAIGRIVGRLGKQVDLLRKRGTERDKRLANLERRIAKIEKGAR